MASWQVQKDQQRLSVIGDFSDRQPITGEYSKTFLRSGPTADLEVERDRSPVNGTG